MKRVMLTFFGVALISMLLFGCNTNKQDKFTLSNDITVVSREDGSGTRGAFIGLFGIEEKDSNGTEVDNTTIEASITNNTSVMMATVQNDIYAIGYASLGSLNDNIKTLKVDGVEPTAENIESGKYKISRPFNIAVKDNLSDGANDFINYILSVEGQEIVSNTGYIPLKTDKHYVESNIKSKVVISGSSSVSPVMEKLKESYIKLNPNANIEIQTSDSTTGIAGAKEGICDIGMASRDLTDSEMSGGIKQLKIAMDGIVIIANHKNEFDNLSKDQVKKIFTGKALNWSEV